MSPHHRLALCLLCSPAFSQSLAVVPSSLTSTEGSETRLVPGISGLQRQQILIDAAQTSSLQGRSIRAILFRRDGDHPDALQSASANIVVRIGSANRSAANAAADFATNLQSPTEVFRGTVIAPASPAPGGPIDWSASNVIRIDFANPWTVPTGTIGIEIEALDDAAADWPIDATSDVMQGVVDSFGAACGARASWVRTASVAPDSLVIGRGSTFTLVGDSGAPAWFLVGLGLRTQPLDLSWIGASGCWLYVDPIVALPGTSTSPGEIPPVFGSFSNFQVHWPADTALLGATLGTQWVELQGAHGLATSNALSCTLSSSPPSLGLVNLTSRGGEPPLVQSFAVPVIGFEID
ncbi:MAG: hypothetical protein U1F36_08860 [Planctomycetota bacterium]